MFGAMSRSMKLYALLDALGLRRSMASKVFALTFVVIQTPLLVLALVYTFLRDALTPTELVQWVLGATLVGVVLLYWLLHLLLAPLRRSADAIQDYMATGHLARLPTHHRDDAGRLMRDLSLALRHLDETRQHFYSAATNEAVRVFAQNPNVAEYMSKVLADPADAPPVMLAMLEVGEATESRRRGDHARAESVMSKVQWVAQRTFKTAFAGLRFGPNRFLFVLFVHPQAALLLLESLMIDERLAAYHCRLGACQLDPDYGWSHAVRGADEALYEAKRNQDQGVVLRRELRSAEDEAHSTIDIARTEKWLAGDAFTSVADGKPVQESAQPAN
jgi:hypothetical protein